jgi:hypothetical protein
MIPQEPQYGDIIIVFAVKDRVSKWFVSDKHNWFLRQYQEPEEVLETVSSDEASTGDLREWTLTCEFDGHAAEEDWYREVCDVIPVLYADFDNKLLINCFPEPGGSFEEGLNSDWAIKSMEPFLHLIPESHQYWMVDGKPIFPASFQLG